MKTHHTLPTNTRFLSLSLHSSQSLSTKGNPNHRPVAEKKTQLEMTKGHAVSLLLIMVLLVGAVMAAPPMAAAAEKLPEIMRRESGGAVKGRFKVDEPVYRFRSMPGLAVPASRLMKLETYEGKPEYDP